MTPPRRRFWATVVAVATPGAFVAPGAAAGAIAVHYDQRNTPANGDVEGINANGDEARGFGGVNASTRPTCSELVGQVTDQINNLMADDRSTSEIAEWQLLHMAPAGSTTAALADGADVEVVEASDHTRVVY